MMQNNPETSKGALLLQNQLERLRLEVVKSRAALQAIQQQGATEQLEELNNGAEEEIGERLAALNKQRMEALLSFRGIQMAMQVFLQYCGKVEVLTIFCRLAKLTRR